MPKPAVTEEPVANAAPASAGPELVSHQAPSYTGGSSCGMIAFLMRRMGVRGIGRAGAVQTPPDSNDEPVGGGLDGWSAGVNAEDQTAKQAQPTPANLPLPISLPPPRRWSPSRSLFKGAQLAKQATRSSQETSTPAPPFMRQSSTRSSTRSSSDAIAAPRAAAPTPSPNLERVEITLLKPAQPRQDALAVPSLGLRAPVPPRGALGGPPKSTSHRAQVDSGRTCSAAPEVADSALSLSLPQAERIVGRRCGVRLQLGGGGRVRCRNQPSGAHACTLEVHVLTAHVQTAACALHVRVHVQVRVLEHQAG